MTPIQVEEIKQALKVAELVCAKQTGLSYRDRRDAHEMVLAAIRTIGEYQAQQKED